MCSRQVTRLLLRSVSVTKDSAIAASCDNLSQLAESDARREEAQHSGLDCSYRVPHLARIGLVSVHLCDSGHRASPTSPRLKRGMTFGAETPLPKPLRALRIPRRVVPRSGSTFHGETELRVLLRRMRNASLFL